MNSEQIIKALECCALGDCYPCPYGNIGAGCRDKMSEDALALIKELTLELVAMRTAANSYKTHNEKLTEENERLMKALDTDISIVRVCRGSGKTAYLREVGRIKVDAIKAYTVRQMKERLTTFFAADDTLKYSEVDAEYINSQIIKISKEMEER